MGRGNILIVDDELTIRDFMQFFLEEHDFNVETAFDGEDALTKFQKGKYDLVISDMMMPRMMGIQLLERIKNADPEQRVILMTGVHEESLKEKASKLGCYLYITKPVRLGELESRILECFPQE